MHGAASGADTSLVRTGVGGLVMGELLDAYRARAPILAGEASGVPTGFHFWIALTSTRLFFFEGGVIARLGAKLAREGSARVHSEIALADVLAITPLDAPEDERLELRFIDESRATVICEHTGEGGAFRVAFEEAKRAARRLTRAQARRGGRQLRSTWSICSKPGTATRSGAGGPGSARMPCRISSR